MKRFNTTAVCIPSMHYMVDLSARVSEIKKMIDAGDYFTINRARQYGKTTTIDALEDYLTSEYFVLSLDFQKISAASFRTEEKFVKAFCRLVIKKGKKAGIAQDIMDDLKEMSVRNDAVLDELFSILNAWCERAEKPIVMIIDEVDTASNNQVFLDFLAQLRADYLAQKKDPEEKTFKSVILAGVTDVKHLKSKIRDEDHHKVNSPWNIAADFDIDMSLSESGIKGMLDEYEEDHQTGMDTGEIAAAIRKYTNGYPYFVSRICQIMDEKECGWTIYHVDEAVKIILQEDNSLFESAMGKLVNFPELKGQLRRILMRGETIAYLPDNEEQKILRMYGFIRNNHNTIAVSNMIFEMRLYNYFIGENFVYDELKQVAASDRFIFIEDDGWLNVEKIMSHFITTHNQIFHGKDRKFLEEDGREMFLTYLSPIINGTGTYSIEEQTRDHRRMDVTIHYLGRRYIIELKIWHGERYNKKGEQQIIDYLNYWNLDSGYMLSFNFNKKKESGVKRVEVGGKVLFEGTV